MNRELDLRCGSKNNNVCDIALVYSQWLCLVLFLFPVEGKEEENCTRCDWAEFLFTQGYDWINREAGSERARESRHSRSRLFYFSFFNTKTPDIQCVIHLCQ